MLLFASRFRTFIAWIAFLIILLDSHPEISLADGKFERIRSDVRRTSSSGGHDHDEDDDDEDDDDEDSFLGQILGGIFICTVTAPFQIPQLALGDDFCLDGFFPLHPYDDVPGHLIIHTEPPHEEFGWFGRFTAQYGDGFDGLSQTGGRLLLDTQSRFGLDTEWYSRRENLSVGGYDELSTGDFNAVIRFAQSEHAEFRAGAGLNWLHDEFDTNYGFNFTYGADFYPARPWILSTTLDLGRIGSTSRFHVRATGGFLYRGVELFGGYDFLEIGDVQIGSPIVGINLWF